MKKFSVAVMAALALVAVLASGCTGVHNGKITQTGDLPM